jgi:hypothetical protein
VLFLLSSETVSLSAGSRRFLVYVLSTDKEDPEFKDWSEEAGRVAYFARGVLDSAGPAEPWFTDIELRQILQQRSVWDNLGSASWMEKSYLSLCEKLSRDPEWRKIISEDLPGWLQQWPGIMGHYHSLRPARQITEGERAQFRSVLGRVWDVDETEAEEFGEDATVAMVFGALVRAWDQVQSLDRGTTQVIYLLKLMERTVSAAFPAKSPDRPWFPSQRFQDVIVIRLARALTRAGGIMKNDNSGDLKDIIDKLADLLSTCAWTLQDELRASPHLYTESQNRDYWSRLRRPWLKTVDGMRSRLEDISVLVIQKNSSAGGTG